MTWRDAGACRGLDTSIFFASNSVPAERICRPCPIAEACLWNSIVVEKNAALFYGVAGGLRPRDRRDLANTVSAAEARFRLASEVEWIEQKSNKSRTKV